MLKAAAFKPLVSRLQPRAGSTTPHGFSFWWLLSWESWPKREKGKPEAESPEFPSPDPSQKVWLLGGLPPQALGASQRDRSLGIVVRVTTRGQ